MRASCDRDTCTCHAATLLLTNGVHSTIVLSCPVLSSVVVSRSALSCPAVSYPVLTCSLLSCCILCRAVMTRSVLRCHVPSCPVMPRPVGRLVGASCDNHTDTRNMQRNIAMRSYAVRASCVNHKRTCHVRKVRKVGASPSGLSSAKSGCAGRLANLLLSDDLCKQL